MVDYRVCVCVCVCHASVLLGQTIGGRGGVSCK